MAPDATGAMRKIPEDARIEPGWALARFGDGGWWPAIERGLRIGALRRGGRRRAGRRPARAPGTPVAWVTAVPSARLGELTAGLAERLAGELGVRLRPARHPPGGSSAAAGDGQRRPAGGQRPGGVRDPREAAAGCRRAGRRPAELGLDAGDGRRSAAPGRGRGRRTGHARQPDVGRPRRRPSAVMARRGRADRARGPADRRRTMPCRRGPRSRTRRARDRRGWRSTEEGSPAGGLRDARGGPLGGRGVHPGAKVRRVI